MIPCRRLLLGVVMLAFTVSACGYSLGQPRSELVQGGLRLHVPVAENRTVDLTAPVALTEALKDAVARHPALRLSEKPSADTLSARVEQVTSETRVLQQGTLQATGKQRLQSLIRESCLHASLRLLRNGLEVWSWQGTECEPAFQDMYQAQSDANRNQALRTASTRLAQRALRDLAEGF